jgi:hypothetical protein
MSDLQVRGPLYGGSGSASPFTADFSGAQRTTDAHSRFFEGASRGLMFSVGMTLTAINNVTFTTATLGATCTPIIGIWNKSIAGSPAARNAVIAQSRLQLVTTALATPTGPGGLIWCTAVGQTQISTGITPLNRATLQTGGSVCVGFANTALTGLSGNLTVQEPSGFTTYPLNASAAETAAGFMPAAPGGIDVIDGAWIVPPGGVLVLLATTTPVAISAASALLWEETLIIP